MIYFLAVVGALTIAVLAWKAFGPQREAVEDQRRAPLAPDDDPDFLRQIEKQWRQKRENGEQGDT